MAKRNPKWHREMKKAVELAGCEVRLTGKHYKILKDGQFVAMYPCSGSDWRGVKNLQAQIRKQGVDIEVPTP